MHNLENMGTRKLSVLAKADAERETRIVMEMGTTKEISSVLELIQALLSCHVVAGNPT